MISLVSFHPYGCVSHGYCCGVCASLGDLGSKKSGGEVQESGGEAAASSAPAAKKQKTLQGFFVAP